MLDDPCVVPRRERVGAGAVREGKQPGKAEAAVAVDARVRRFAAFVAAHERLDYRAAKLLPQVEGHVGHAERVARGARSQNGIGGAAGTLGVRPVRIEPEPQSDADRIRQRLQQRDCAVDTAAHRNGNTAGHPRSAKNRPDRVGERIDRKRLPTNGSSLEQSQSNERTIKPGSISLNNAFAVELKPNKREFVTARRITNQFNHELRLAAIAASAGFAGARYPAPKFSGPPSSAVEVIMPRRRRGGLHGQTLPCPAPAVNLDSQVGALPASGRSRHRTQAPLASLLVLH
jgi:hypothetical protein